MLIIKPSQQKAIVVGLVQEQLKKERKEWMQRCISAITASMAADLMDKFYWPVEDVNKLLSSATQNFQNMLDEFVTVDDFLNWCKEKNINIE